MKRLAIMSAAVVGIAAIGATALPWLVSEETVRAAVVREVEALTGRTPRIDGAVRFRLLPLPTVEIEGVSLAGLPNAPPLLQAAAMEGRLSLLSLLAGRLDITAVTLRRPRLALVGRDNGDRSWAFEEGALAEAARGKPGKALSIGKVRFLDGTVSYADARSQRSVIFNLRDGKVDWAGAGSSLSVSADCIWRGQAMAVSFSVDDPSTLLSGGKSAMRGKVTSDLARLSLDGELSGVGALEGDIGLSAGSLRRAMRWIGVRIADGDNLGAFKLQSPVSIDADGVTMAASQVELDGNAAEGAMRLQIGGERPKLSGTLAADTLDATPYANEFRLAGKGGGVWREDPLELETFAVLDLDLRLSAAETVVGKARLGRTAAALVTQNGAAEFSLGEANAYGGTMSGRLTIRKIEPQLSRVDAQLQFTNVEIGRALEDFLAFHRIEGPGSGSLELSGTGRSINDILAGLGGKIDLSVENGSLIGVDLAALMQRVARRPLSASLQTASGRTAFEKLSAHFAVTGGVASSSDVMLTNGGLDVRMDGKATLRDRKLDLAGTAIWQSDETAPPVQLPFRVSGDWARPRFIPDTDVLIRRSDAAAELMRAGAQAFAPPIEASTIGSSRLPALLAPDAP